MTVYVKTSELSSGIIAMTFNGRLTLGDQLTDVECAIREHIVQGQRKLVLDFSGLNYIDSAGIGVIVVCIGLMKRAGGRLAVAGVAGQVKQLLTLTGLHPLLETYPDLSSAQVALAGPARPSSRAATC
jgi:anti-sigma B factor antagonist